jgi:hypothetical protein
MMRATIHILVALLGLAFMTIAAPAASNPLTGEWTGSITPKGANSVSATVSLKDGGALTLFVTRTPGAYVYSGRWAYASGRLSLTFTQISPHATTGPFWAVGDKEIANVQFDKSNPKKIYVRFEGDPWLMTLFKR